MSPVRRTAAVAAAPPPPPHVEGEALDIFNLGAYAGGKTIPEGDYAVEFIAQEYQAVNQAGQAAGKPRTGVMLVAYPLSGGDAQEQFVSLGTKAILSWVPNATGKGFVKRAGGAGVPPTNKSNWLLFLDSIKQCCDPSDWDAIQGKDFTALDGIWMHIKPVPEPEERKSFRRSAATGEAGAEGDDEPRGSGMVPNCTEIIEGGKPWLGGGGFDFVQAAAPAAPAPVAARPAPRRVGPTAAAPAPAAPAPVARRVPAAPPTPPPPAAEEPPDEETLEMAAMGVIADVLQQPAFANGVQVLKLRMETHGIAVKKYDDQTATDILNTYFSNDTTLANLLGLLQYKIKGTGPQRMVVPAV